MSFQINNELIDDRMHVHESDFRTYLSKKEEVYNEALIEVQRKLWDYFNGLIYYYIDDSNDR